MSKLLKELKQQLEEKNKEIEYWKSKMKDKILNMKTPDFIKMCLSCGVMVKANEEDNMLAIQELEKVKKLLLEESKTYPIVYDITDDLVGGAIDKDAVFKIIDQQIKSLKGEPKC